MKYMRFAFAFCGGMILFLLGMAALGVPTDLPAWRWLLGLALISGSIVVWDKWV